MPPGRQVGSSAFKPVRRCVILAMLIALFTMAGPARADSPATIHSSFGATGIAPNGTTSLSYTISNPNQGTGLSSVGFTDTLPSGLVIANPNGLSGDCGGGTITATAGSGSVSLSTASLGRAAFCAFSVNVVGTTSGVKSNSVTVGSSAGTGNTSTATLEVWSPPSVVTTLTTSIFAGGVKTVWMNDGDKTPVWFDIGNLNTTTPLTGVGFTDALPAGLVVANPNGLTRTCGGGTITATPGTHSISLSGATLIASPDPNSECDFSVDLVAAGNGVQTNSTGPVSSNEAGSGAAAADSVSVFSPGPRIYWGEFQQHSGLNPTGDIQFAKTDGSIGSVLVQSASSGDSGTAIDSAAGRVYWADLTANKITFSNVDDSGRAADLSTFGSALHAPYGLAIDPPAGLIYWANNEPGTKKISFARLDDTGGGQIDTTGATSIGGASGVTIDTATGRLYWTNVSPDKISFANLNGSGGGGDLKTTGATLNGPIGAAIDPTSGRIYWANQTGNKISYAKLDGSGGGGDLNTAGATVSAPQGVAIDPAGGRIYWANLTGGEISYAKLDGSGGADLPTPSVTPTASSFPLLLEPPLAAGPPTVTGGSTTGSQLSCSPGTWAPDLLGSFLYRSPRSFAYQWSLNGTDLGGATASTYTASAAGDYRCRITALNAAGSSASTSAAATITIPLPPTCQPVSTSVVAGRAALIALSCHDSAGSPLRYAISSNPAHGVLGALDSTVGEVIYTAAAAYRGQDSFTYRATSANGTAQAQTVSITVKPGTAGGRPAITSARLTHQRFRVSKQATAIKASKVPLGTSFRFVLSAPARLQITLTRSIPGLLSGRRCLAPTRTLKHSHAKRCTRKVTAGTLIRANEPRGPGSVAFSGRIGRHALGAGAYHAVLVARNATGSSTPVTLAFTIVP